MCNKNFQTVVRVFIELRDKGTSLSGADLNVLDEWESQSIQPEFICKVMREIFLDCKEKNKPFPKNLTKISKNVMKIIKKMQDV